MTFISGFLSGSSLAVPIKTFRKTPDIILMMHILIIKVFPVGIFKSSLIYNTHQGEKVTQNNTEQVSSARKGMKIFRLLSLHKQTYAKKWRHLLVLLKPNHMCYVLKEKTPYVLIFMIICCDEKV